jgi:hypothetical protein
MADTPQKSSLANNGKPEVSQLTLSRRLHKRALFLRLWGGGFMPSMWVLFARTLNPSAADGWNVAGEEQPTSLEPFARGWTNPTTHPESRIFTPAPPDIADDLVETLLKFSRLIFEDTNRP